MHRRDFLGAVSAAAASAGFLLDESAAAALLAQVNGGPPGAAPGAAPGATPAAPPPWPAPFDGPPVLQNPAPDAITVFACVGALTTAWVEYGTTESLGQVASGSVHGLRTLSGRVHRVRLEGLRPATKYFYRVMVCPIDFKGAYKIRRGAPVASKTFAFTTLDEGKGAMASIEVLNDTHENAETLRCVTSQIAARDSDLVVWNGDIFNDVRSDPQIVEQIVRPAGAETGAAMAAVAPLCFVSGNHDVRGIHARSLDAFLEHPGGRRRYALRQGPLAVIVLDTGEDKPDGHREYAGLGDFEAHRAEQRRWLERAVTEPSFRDAPFRVVFQHIPMFGKASSEDSRRQWLPVLAKAKIDLMVCGHVHERAFLPADAERPFAQLVGGGPAPPSATVIRLEADRKRLRARVFAVDGRTVDEHEIRA